ncbi:hypothetical protein QN277_019818 [Acacia crassicarpa]|uniref:TF-B3 domain-containing protein n=1 Tax=Acacia crassicarpa TaxID=499986 RepID=A0AAE1MKF0_9FABA|nr:hypothetical protein QN277_019818 [Acacia crassicarpa]
MASHFHPPGPINFFKIILKSNLESIIPNKFTRRYGSGLSNPVLLKPPDGKEWKVHLKTHDNEVWFQEGWNEFARFYSLDEGHLILFKYEGTSWFDVHLFDMSALEIDYPSSSNENNVRDDTVEISDEMPSNRKARNKTLLPSFRPDKKMRILPKSHVVSETNHGQYQGTEFQKSTNAVELKFPKKEPEEDTGVRISSACLNSEHRRKRALTTMEKIRAINSSSSFKSKYPFFMVIMQPSYVRHKCHLVMPTKFAKTHLEKERGVVQLEARDGRTWTVKYKIPTIKDGWEKFVMENGLKVGQVCIFEMIGRVFKVHIFGDQEEVKSRQRIYNLAEDLKVKKEQISSMQHTPFEKAISFKSEYPHFMVKMTNAYICGKSNLHVPSHFARKHLHDCTESIKLVVQDIVWSVEYVFRMITRGIEAHEFSSVGWRRFREDNNLKVGDICVFELNPDIKLTFQVTILRATKTPSSSYKLRST